jgi:hypothetical protein
VREERKETVVPSVEVGSKIKFLQPSNMKSGLPSIQYINAQYSTDGYFGELIFI